MEFITIDVSCLLSANKLLTDSINDSYSFYSTAGKRYCRDITWTLLIFFFFQCGTAGAVVLPPFHICAFFTAGVRDCGSSSFTPFHIRSFSTVGVQDGGSSSFTLISYLCFFH